MTDESPTATTPAPGTARRSVRLIGYRALVVIGLAGVAITQPLLDVLGANPEFFVAGNYTRGQIALVALLVVAVPSSVGVVLVAGTSWLNRRAGTVAFRALVACLAGLFVLVLLRSADIDNVVIAAVLAVSGGVGAVFIERSCAPVRTFLSYLSLGQLVFAGLFLFGSRTSELLADSGWNPEARGAVEMPEPEGPVVVVVLDELPIATLLTEDGSVNDERFPGFARLADRSTFFRNASSINVRTHLAVPELLSGTVATKAAVPTYSNYERNLFTLLGPEMPVQRYEIVTDLCPEQLCPAKPPESTRQALHDTSIVYGHRVLPDPVRSWLPDIDQSWGNFGLLDDGAAAKGSPPGDSQAGEDESPTDGDDSPTEDEIYAKWFELGQSQQSPSAQLQILEGMASEVTDEPALHLIHVALPHGPWVLTPDGQHIDWHPPEVEDPEAAGFDWYWRQLYQRHAAQLGATDRAIGTLIDQLDAVGAWDDALVVVTSDHGVSLLPPPDFGRTPENNIEGARCMPLFIKAPGQTEGEVNDDVAQTIDILPSIADLLGVETDWDFDGHSLYDGSERQLEPDVSTDTDALFDLVERHKEDFPHGDDWTGLAAVGKLGDLVGQPVDDFREGTPSDWSWTLDQRSAFDNLALDGPIPEILGGEVRRIRGQGKPPELLVAVNGEIAGVAGGFVGNGDNKWRYSAFLAAPFREGSNTVAAYEVERTKGGVVLHPVAEAG